MEKNKENKSTSKTVAIIILAVLLFGSIGYIGYISHSKITLKEDNKNIRENVKQEELDINNDLIQRLFSIFRIDQTCYMSVDNLNNNNLVKLRLAYNNLGESDFSSISCSKVGIEIGQSSYCGARYMDSEMSNAYGSGDMNKFKEALKNNSTKSIDANILRRKVRELFGSDFKVKDEDFGTGHVVEPSCYLMHYDKEKDLYAEYSCEGGGTCGGGIKQTVKKAIKTGDKLEIVTDLFNEGDNKSTIVTYYFKFDKENYNYVFDKVEES